MSALPRAECLSNTIAKEVIARIAQGVYKTGERLAPERVLAKEMNVSRLSLREALLKLQALGVIQPRQGSGNYVNDFGSVRLPAELTAGIIGFGADILDEIITARKAVEQAAAALAVQKRTDEDLDRLRECLAEMRASVDYLDKFVPADMRFHRLIAEAGKNRVLLKMLDTIEEQQRFSQIFTAYMSNDQERAVRFHEEILIAIVRQDAKAVYTAIDDHLRDMEQYASQKKSIRTKEKDQNAEN